ncbi:MAG: hypothetical protein FWG47_05015 [Propionibacteriaceae bacterium]|nr:hypothetical protein [Propionibacteriaceae bacterium]
MDSHNAPVDAWAEPTLVQVYAWAPTSMTQNVDGNRRPVVADVDLLVPVGVCGAPRDRWTLLGKVFEQVGDFEDYTTGPWPGSPGGRIRLKRVKG